LQHTFVLLLGKKTNSFYTFYTFCSPLHKSLGSPTSSSWSLCAIQEPQF